MHKKFLRTYVLLGLTLCSIVAPGHAGKLQDAVVDEVKTGLSRWRCENELKLTLTGHRGELFHIVRTGQYWTHPRTGMRFEDTRFEFRPYQEPDVHIYGCRNDCKNYKPMRADFKEPFCWVEEGPNSTTLVLSRQFANSKAFCRNATAYLEKEDTTIGRLIKEAFRDTTLRETPTIVDIIRKLALTAHNCDLAARRKDLASKMPPPTEEEMREILAGEKFIPMTLLVRVEEAEAKCNVM